MNIDENSLLLAFNGAKTSFPAVDYGVWLAEQIGVPVTVLGIVEKRSRQQQVESVIETTTQRLKAAGLPYRTQLIRGNSYDVIRQQAVPKHHLTVFGPFDRPILQRWLRGRSFRRIFEEIDTPVLYVKRSYAQLRKILVCLGGLGYARSAESWALFLAQFMDASVTLFHVVEPISYQYPTAQEIENHWEDIIQTDTPQGQNLRDALKYAQDMNISAAFQVRHGNIVSEITAEVSSQEYDLVVLGAPSSSTSLRHLFMPNVTAEIAETVDCPVLAAKFGQEWIFTGSV
jgi:nucleotide-binding universal stress UspA family protein